MATLCILNNQKKNLQKIECIGRVHFPPHIRCDDWEPAEDTVNLKNEYNCNGDAVVESVKTYPDPIQM